jgi:hypothetical protein
MADPRQRPDPRQQPGTGRNDDPDLGQKEAQKEKAELEKKNEEKEDQLEPMTEGSSRSPQRPTHPNS